MSAHPAEHLTGFALCTDDDLCALGHAATTREFCANSSAPDVEYLEVEWHYDEGRELFDNSRKFLRALYEKADSNEAFTRHVDASFVALEGALASLREQQLVDPKVLLIVASSDPGPSILSRMVSAAAAICALGQSSG